MFCFNHYLGQEPEIDGKATDQKIGEKTEVAVACSSEAAVPATSQGEQKAPLAGEEAALGDGMSTVGQFVVSAGRAKASPLLLLSSAWWSYVISLFSL